ncbi:hypothetical protein Ahp1_13 [Aeromonas phage Ahp1]|uniref:Uncharacterized protein n=1 Tax=Aeromonas phage Ahp1 TaxID=1747286 RepID=A0A1S5Q8D3_9CAUD|nr:hypothetical protein HOS19_gp13 [Aeromonas phage Ahp1]ALP47732.1 hypothetical protein Ahp1_13 [Aeromonas phage Ahp1]
MIVKEIVKVERNFELGDLLIVRENMRGCSYRAGDFILIHRVPDSSDRFYYFTTPGTVKGDISCASGGAAWLNDLLDKGVITYEGNVK